MPLPSIYNHTHDTDTHYGKFVHSKNFFKPKSQSGIWPILVLVAGATTLGILGTLKHAYFNTHVSWNHKSFGSWNKEAPMTLTVGEKQRRPDIVVMMPVDEE